MEIEHLPLLLHATNGVPPMPEAPPQEALAASAERPPLMGRFADLAKGSLSAEEFKALRREGWGNNSETDDHE